MRRLYWLHLLPGLSAALFLAELMRRHGYANVSVPLWLGGLLLAAAMAGLWLAYARFLARLLQVPYEQALRLDLISYLPFVALLAYFLPIFQHTVNAATYLVLTTVALSLALKAAVVLAHFQDGLRALLARPYLVVGAIAGLGLVLRLSLIAANRFHGDEALYAHWGLLIAGGQDVWLRTEIV
ncbi:MAG TPA: hypothetical protein PLB78_16075, partial [Anaerolineae bacterium]|nr:hypothetical protein [Anaerolineae bacterium]